MSVIVEEMVPRRRFIRYDGSNAAGILAAFNPGSGSSWALDWETGGQARFYVTNDGTTYRLVSTGDYVAEDFGVMPAEEVAASFIPIADLAPGG